jgi:hypothetical protein
MCNLLRKCIKVSGKQRIPLSERLFGRQTWSVAYRVVDYTNLGTKIRAAILPRFGMQDGAIYCKNQQKYKYRHCRYKKKKVVVKRLL